MKILHVTNASGWSGGLEQMRILIEELEKRKISNLLVCPPECELIPKLNSQNTIIEPLQMAQDYDIFAARELYKIIQSTVPDIVQAHHPIAHAVALLAMTFNSEKPFIVSRRVSFSPRKNPFSRWKYGSKRITAYTVVSQSVKDTLAASGVDSRKIHVIYSAFQNESFYTREPNAKLKNELQITRGHSVIGKIANCATWKGQHIFLAAAKIALEKNPDCIFLLAGKDTETLRSKIEELGISKSVRLLGFRKDIPEILSILDLSVNSAVSGEGLSGAIRESLAMQIPVIASNIAGNQEIVRDGITGLLAPANDPRALADQIFYALGHRTEMRKMAAEGKRWVTENTSSQIMVEKYIKLYSAVLK